MKYHLCNVTFIPQVLSVTINNADGYTDIYPGGQSIYELVIDIPASGVYSDLKVKVTADNTTFPSTGICDIYLADLDDNLPCLVHHDPSFKTYDLNRDFNSEGSLTIGPVINNGNVTASLKVYVVIVLLDDLIQDGDVVNTFLTVEYNNNSVWTGTASRTHSTPLPALTQVWVALSVGKLYCIYPIVYHTLMDIAIANI